jgi:CheY-like chemotaxis protein
VLARLQQRLESLAGSVPPPAEDRSLRPVLIIDPDDFGRETLGQILVADGYRVVRARNGGDGLRKLRGTPAPGLVVLDMPPPCLDGWQFVRTQERDPRLRDIPVIVLSSLDLGPLCRPFRAVVAHFEKPVTVDGLLAAIHRHLPPA